MPSMNAAPPKPRLRVPEFDPAAVARAEAGLKALSVKFNDWMAEEVDRLEAAFQNAAQRNFAADALPALFARAHDVKGLAATYEFPLASRIADVICRLLETDARMRAARANRALLQAAVQAIRACLRDDIRTDRHPVGAVLARELEQQTAVALQTLSEE